MSDKIKWDDLYKDFKLRYPSWKNKILRWAPYGYLTIKVWFKDDTVMVYDYERKRAVFVKD